MHSIGLDIGTTTICACVTSISDKRVVKTYTVDNDSFIESENSWEKIQNPEVILNKIYSILDDITNTFDNLTSIAISGQMHGILFVDKDKNPLTPLYIWQDQRGNLPFEGSTYAKHLSDISKGALASGFGGVTAFFNTKRNLIPKEAVKLCTIADYVATKLSDSKNVYIHSSNAASLGLYDLENARFDKESIEAAGMDFSLFPEVKDSAFLLGKYKDIPVGISIGDNQAAYTGSVENMEESILVNMGTGSQISVFSPDYIKVDPKTGCELRPLNKGEYIIVGSSLCGGRAYAILEKFFKETIKLLTGDESNKSLYKEMDRLSEKAFEIENKLDIKTTFSGTRQNPNLRGSIENIDIENFTPTHLITGVLEGSVNELFDMYDKIKDLLVYKPKMLVGSGNGIRKSDVWKKIFEEKFELNLSVPQNSEEAAFGASLFGMVCAGVYKDIKLAQKDMIKYEERST